MTDRDLIRASSPWRETPYRPPDTGQLDSPANVAKCLGCPLMRCMHDSVLCPLRGGDGKIKAAKPRKRARPKREPKPPKPQGPEEMALRCLPLIRNGGTDGWICRELGIDREALKKYRKQLVKAGLLAK